MQTRKWFSVMVVALAPIACTEDEPRAECGNDSAESPEQCDGTDTQGATCAGLGFVGGELACDDACSFDTSGCTGTTCGNGSLDLLEDCEGADLNDASCEQLGFSAGTLACSDSCELDTSGCGPPRRCGNGQRDSEEVCDGNDLNGESCTGLGYLGGTLNCSQTCRFDVSQCTGCTDDAQEPNGDQSSAASLSLGTHALEMCNLDGVEADWFAVGVTAGETLVAMVRPADATLALSTGLVDDAGIGVGAFVGLSDGQAWMLAPAATSIVYLWVAPALQHRGVGSYTIELVSEPACISDHDCSGTQLCQDFTCQASTCAEEQDCPVGFFCHESSCVECVSSTDCGDPTWLSCTNGRCSMGCAADAYEPNDTFDVAAPIVVGSSATGLTLCGDEDWFEVTLADGQRYLIDAEFTHAAGDIDLAVYEASAPDVVVAGGNSRTDGERAVLIGNGSAYLVLVSLSAGVAQSYDLALTDSGAAGCLADADCAGAGEVCLDYACVVPDCLADADCSDTDRCVGNTCVAEPNGDTCAGAMLVASLPFAQTRDIIGHRGRIDVSGDGCAPWGAEGNDAVYQVALPAGSRLHARLSSDFDAVLLVVSACSTLVAESACLAGADEAFGGGSETVDLFVENDGTYFVVVDAFTPGYPEAGSYSLSLSVD